MNVVVKQKEFIPGMKGLLEILILVKIPGL
jgi:hypothetical protein